MCSVTKKRICHLLLPFISCTLLKLEFNGSEDISAPHFVGGLSGFGNENVHIRIYRK